MNNDKVLEIKNLSMTYHTLDGETHALDDISLNINRGEIVVLVGPSGCGKSTLLSIIADLIEPSKGEVLLNNEKLKKSTKDVGYMFQKDNLFEWRTIKQNSLIGLEIQDKVTKEGKEFVEHLLDIYGLGEFKDSYPSQLSGGMRQRVALIRTLATRPNFLLLDEPFSALDYQTRLAISDEIGQILRKEKKTALMVTHDISEAISMADKVVVLSKRPGRIKDIIPIQLTCPDCDRSPMKSREAPEFKDYFNRIWKELDVHV
ncbi:ABC transporter ATP-binding protein [Clostridium sp. D2Q-14]|uniref:ABC transporter ATP-binding protein n=1 Tax=Anaeromonas gelatinilytica TaxID=2683194 RepID=UPI00193C526D|nr:ABC transporter ATP-binding protein [Anaeromonas gelatinilytica]MBS4534742.1 ABC transporter ATP-binding protein [Anaeromonas gelatinilytica]